MSWDIRGPWHICTRVCALPKHGSSQRFIADESYIKKNVTPLALPNASNANGKSLGYIRSRHVLIISVSDALCNTSPSSKNLSKGEPGGSGLIFSKERSVNCAHGGALFVPILNQ